MTEPLIFKDKDSLLRLTLMGGQARALLARTTRLTQEAADIHQASDVAACAMGRLLSGCAMMNGLYKDSAQRLTVTVSGNGAGGKMTCGATDNKLKIAVEHPQAEIPPLADGRQDVARFVGRDGNLVVVRDQGKGEPFTSVSKLISGELGEDFASYFTVSEQIPSLVALGCLNQHGTVLSAGGILIQALPGCEDSTISALELRIPIFAGISREIYDRSLMELSTAWFSNMEMRVLGEEALFLRCDCSREKMYRALNALGRKELEEIRDSGEATRMTCHFCRRERVFDSGDVAKLLKGEADSGTD